MPHRTTFTETEAADLRRIVRQKQSTDRTEQKALRHQLRSRGFFISDFGDFGLDGFTVPDFDDLIAHGSIRITRTP